MGSARRTPTPQRMGVTLRATSANSSARAPISAGHPQTRTASCTPTRGRGPSPAQDRRAATCGQRRAAPGSRPRRRPPRRHNPPRHSPPTTTGWRQDRYPVVSKRPLHSAMQQRCHHASASARSPSWPPMPRPRLQRAATPGQRRLSSQLLNRIPSRVIGTSRVLT
jgi:hypothetical protein